MPYRRLDLGGIGHYFVLFMAFRGARSVKEYGWGEANYKGIAKSDHSGGRHFAFIWDEFLSGRSLPY